MASRGLCSGSPSKISELLTANSCSVYGPLATTSFTVNQCFKAKIIVFIDDLLFAVS